MKAFYRELLLFAFFVLASGFVLRPLPFHLGDKIPAGTDPPHHVYILNWLLDHGLSKDRFEGRMFHPARAAVLRSDLSMGTVVLVAPLAPIVEEPLVRFNLANWFALAFSGWAFCLLARSWTQSTLAGVFAGITAVLGSHQSLHYVHLNLLSVGWLPIFLLALDRLLTSGSKAFAVAVVVGVSFALVASSSGYYGVAACVIAVIFLLRNPTAIGLKLGLAAALLAGLLLTPYLTAYATLHSEESLVRTSRELAKGSWTLADMGSRTLLHRIWNPALGEPLFPGFCVIGLSAFALWRGSSQARTLGLVAVILFWLGVGEPGGLYRLLALIPPFSSMRHPVTLTAVAVMLLSVLAALGLARLQKIRAPLAWLLLGLGAIETLAPKNDFFDVAPGVPAVYEVLLKLPAGPVLEVPPYEPTPLIWAARRDFETLNGGGAFIPDLTVLLETAIQNHWFTDSFQPIDETKAADILLNKTAMRYLILPAGRQGGSFAPLIQRFRESRCFKELGIHEKDVLFEAIREASCPAWMGAPTQAVR